MTARKRKIYDSRSTLYKSSTTSSSTTRSGGGGGGGTYKSNKTYGSTKAEANSNTYSKEGSFSDDYYRRRYAPPKGQERFYSSSRRRRHDNVENLEDFIKDFEELFCSSRRSKRFDDSYCHSERTNPMYTKLGNQYQTFTLRNILESTPFFRLFGKMELLFDTNLLCYHIYLPLSS